MQKYEVHYAQVFLFCHDGIFSSYLCVGVCLFFVFCFGFGYETLGLKWHDLLGKEILKKRMTSIIFVIYTLLF